MVQKTSRIEVDLQSGAQLGVERPEDWNAPSATLTFDASLTVSPGDIAVPPARIVAELGITTAANSAPPATSPAATADSIRFMLNPFPI